MNDDLLKTRDGKVISGPGSWEREQMAKEDKPAFVPLRRKKNDPEMRGISYCLKKGQYKPHFSVRPYHNGKFQRIDRVYVHEHESTEATLIAAKELRDKRQQLLNETGTDLPGRKQVKRRIYS